MEIFTNALGIIIGFGSVLFVAWAFVDAFSFDKQEFADAERLPRIAWLGMLAFGFALVIWLGASSLLKEPFGLRSVTWLAVMVVAGLYFYDQRPRLLNARIRRSH